MSSTRAVSQTRLSTALRPLARLRSGRNDRFFCLRKNAPHPATIQSRVLISGRAAVMLVSENPRTKISMKIKTRILAISTCVLVLSAPAPLFAAKGAKKNKQGKPVDPAERAARPGRLLKTYDTDKNGAIDGTEVEALKKAFDADKTGPLQKLDANSDGTLDDSEVAAIKAHRGKGAAGKVGRRKNKKA